MTAINSEFPRRIKPQTFEFRARPYIQTKKLGDFRRCSPGLFIAVQNLVIFTEALLSLLIRVVSFVDALTFSRVR